MRPKSQVSEPMAIAEAMGRHPGEFRITLYFVLRVAESALKHGCSIEDISHAYDMVIVEYEVDPEAEPPKILTIGPDGAGNLLELIGAEQANGDYLVWHAMRCRPQYLALLPGGGS